VGADASGLDGVRSNGNDPLVGETHPVSSAELATILVDKPGWQLALAVFSGLVSGAISFEYAKYRSGTNAPVVGQATAPTGQPAVVTIADEGTLMVNQPIATLTGSDGNFIDQSQKHDHSRRYITINSPTSAASRGKGFWASVVDGIDDTITQAGVGGLILLLIVLGFLVRAAFAHVANA
jgi:hypothetical protein